MILRGMLLIISIFMLLVGFLNVLSPDVNNFLIPIEINDLDTRIMVRSLSGIFIGVGYLSIRFIFSSSRVQIGNVLLSITVCAIFSKLCSFMYDGFTTYSVIVFFLVVFYGICLYYLQKKRKNQIDYNL
jgi:hypothetical protein